MSVETINFSHFFITPLVKKLIEESIEHEFSGTEFLDNSQKKSRLIISASHDTWVCGVAVASLIFSEIDPGCRVSTEFSQDIFSTLKHTKILTVEGRTQNILRGLKIAKYMLETLSGISNSVKEFIQPLENSETKLLVYHALSPNFRYFENAVSILAGAEKRQFGMSKALLIYREFWQLNGGIAEVLDHLHESLASTVKVQVEVHNSAECQEAIQSGADLLLLQKFSEKDLELAIRTARNRAILEYSGYLTPEEIKRAASAGIHYVSSAKTLQYNRDELFSVEVSQ